MTIAPASSGSAAVMAMTSKASSRDPIAIEECGASNPANLSVADVQALRAGGSADGLRILYPYDGTVFPRGMIAPDLMFELTGAEAEALYLHIRSQAFEYSGCLPPTAAAQLSLVQDIWDQAGQRTFGKDDVYTVELSAWRGGKVIGPVTSTFKIAQATIKGSIYYNSYNSQLMAMGTSTMMPPGGFFGGGPMGGLVLRIPAGGRAEVFGQTACNGCHSV